MPFFLIGYMGCGKSTIGKKVAKICNLPFLDLDALIEQETGMKINAIFTHKGEDFFRKKESSILHNYSFKKNMLIATGGGTPCFYDNHAFMNSVGVTIYLKVSLCEIVKRLQLDNKRPLLFNNKLNLKDFVREHLSIREKEYLLSDHIIESDNISIDDVRQIIKI